MEQLLVHLRAMQLFNHYAHNISARVAFFADHEFFGELYEANEADYDAVIERMIGLKGSDSLNLPTQLMQVQNKLAQVPAAASVKENYELFRISLMMEQELCSMVMQVIRSGVSEGTRQMLGDICDRSEMRQYKLKQRLKK